MRFADFLDLAEVLRFGVFGKADGFSFDLGKCEESHIMMERGVCLITPETSGKWTF